MLVTGTKSGLVCVNAKNGALLWNNKFSRGQHGQLPYARLQRRICFLGQRLWQRRDLPQTRTRRQGPRGMDHEDMVCHHGGYVIDNGYIYGNHEGEWVCLELKTGRKMWSEKGVGKGSLCWADGMLYLFSENGGRAALATCSPRGLQIKGQVKVEGEGTVGPTPS